MIRRPFLDLAAALLGALLLLWTGIAHAQTIRNIAHASWTVDGRTGATQSNLVTLTLAPAAMGAT